MSSGLVGLQITVCAHATGLKKGRCLSWLRWVTSLETILKERQFFQTWRGAVFSVDSRTDPWEGGAMNFLLLGDFGH